MPASVSLSRRRARDAVRVAGLTLTWPVREIGHERRMRCELRVK
jgi:hypothetical protein